MWYDVLHTPSIHSREAWKGACLRVSLPEYPDQEEYLAGSRRATVVPEVLIVNGTKLMVESVLQDVSEGQVETLQVNLYNIPTNTDVALLVQAVTKVENCGIGGGQSGQLETILSAVSEGPDIAIKTLYLYGQGVAQVSPDILGTAAVKLTSLYLGYHPTSRQIEGILTRLATTQDNKLRKFRFDGGLLDISHLSPKIVTEALRKIENPQVFLPQVLFSSSQIRHLHLMNILPAPDEHPELLLS